MILPTALVKVQDATGFDGESRVAWEYPNVPPRSQCVLAEPAPERRATDLRNYAVFHGFAAHSLSDQCAKGNPRRAGSSQASALISTMTPGGKARGSWIEVTLQGSS